MKHWVRYLAILALAVMACDTSRPGVINNLLLGGDNNWLERDGAEDPYEYQNGQCCNDYFPAAVEADTSIMAVINPKDDLDYYDFSVTGDNVLLLHLSALTDQLVLRIFSGGNATGDVEFEIAIDSLQEFPSEADDLQYNSWTFVTGTSRSLRALVQNGGPDSPIDYELRIQKLIPTVGLDLLAPGQASSWERGQNQIISWSSKFASGVTVALINEAVTVQVLKRDILGATELSWTPEIDLPTGTYRLLVYLADDPTVLEVSDAITIQ